ncbi:MAG: FAD-dependent oxidoreductase [Rhodovibrionaceae bacterium]
MTAPPGRIAIVGASAAGLAATQALRDEGFTGEIALIGAEPEAPYDRPPLSKGRIASAADHAQVALADAEELAALSAELRFGVAAKALDLKRRRVILENGEEIAWDACVIATGAEPIALPGGGLTLRSLGDAVEIAAAIDAAEHIAIVGAGVLGCELAALARQAGVAVTVIDPQAGPMLDRLGPRVAGRLEEMHRAQGVAFRFGSGVETISGDAAGGYRIAASDGTTVEADRVFVAIGCRPAVGWLTDSGLALDNGVVCDATCQAAPGVFAVGDVANWYNPRYGRRMRIEHRMNATEQGMAAAANLLGAGRPFDPIPFFWTDQYDAKIQVHGVIDGTCDTDFLMENSESGGFAVAYSRHGRIEGVLGWNMARELRRARSLIGQDRETARAELAQKQGA